MIRREIHKLRDEIVKKIIFTSPLFPSSASLRPQGRGNFLGLLSFFCKKEKVMRIFA